MTMARDSADGVVRRPGVRADSREGYRDEIEWRAGGLVLDGGRSLRAEPGLARVCARRVRPEGRRHRRLPRRQHHGGADLRQDRRELHAAPVPRSQGPLHQRGLGRRHGRRRAQAARSRRPRPRGDRADRRLRDQRHRLGHEGRRRAQEDLPRRDPGHRRAVQGAGRPGLHRLGGDHRRGPRHGREGVPPGDVRRGDGARPIAGRAFHRHPAHDAARSSGRSWRRTPRPRPNDQATPPRRRRRPPQRPGPTRDGVRDPQGPGRTGRGLRGVDRRRGPEGGLRVGLPRDEPLRRPRRAGRSSSTGSTTDCRSISASSGPCSSATCRSPTS